MPGTLKSTYQKWVEEFGIEGAKAKMREIGRKGGRRGGGKAGFHTMTKSKLRKISAMGGKASAKDQSL